MKQYANIEASWKAALADVVKQDEMDVLSAFLEGEHQAGKTIYPAPHQYFAAFNLTPLDKVKVVILGQDPYHGEGQGHGLCFSVAPDVRIPPSLRNIYQELRQDLGITTPQHGCLASWAKEGVLLLNSVLTVEKGLAGSHQKQGWERFTDHIIRVLNEQKAHVVFILWGSYAQKKGACIDASQHLILKAVHPSPLSAYRGFFGGRYFSKTNAYLTQHGLVPIEWTLPADDQIETNVFKEKPFDKQMVLGEMK